jgi:ABC-type transport system involved in multi-copper enzyme maturation permease subunit
MELLLVAGLVALIVLVLLGLYLFQQERRSGTVRAVLTAPASRDDDADVDVES